LLFNLAQFVNEKTIPIVYSIIAEDINGKDNLKLKYLYNINNYSIYYSIIILNNLIKESNQKKAKIILKIRFNRKI